MVSVYYLSKQIGNKIELFLSNISKKNPSFIGENFMNNLPFFISIYFILNYGFELCSLLVDHKLYASYMIMLCKIFKEVGKYLVFLLLSSKTSAAAGSSRSSRRKSTPSSTRNNPPVISGPFLVFPEYVNVFQKYNIGYIQHNIWRFLIKKYSFVF